jgi:hypothetical protein
LEINDDVIEWLAEISLLESDSADRPLIDPRGKAFLKKRYDIERSNSVFEGEAGAPGKFRRLTHAALFDRAFRRVCGKL